MTTTIKPTIGRRVWYWPSEEEARESSLTYADKSQPCDAGIAFVHSDRMVNLTVADHRGVMHRRCSVPLLQEGDPTPMAGTAYAQWMPYQVGQATRASNTAPT